jgi:hypothetical protein
MIRVMPFIIGAVFGLYGYHIGGFLGWSLMILMAILMLILDNAQEELNYVNNDGMGF